MDRDNYPKESESQEIGQYAVAAFNSLHPLGWRVIPTDGDSDVGLDMQIQLVDKRRYQGVFHAQIKGSREKGENTLSKSLSADKTFYSIELKVSTLNYYVQVANPVMLVFVDLSTDDDPRKCKAYYLWINDEIDSLLDGHLNLNHLNTKTHSFQLPTINVLDEDLDVLPYLVSQVKKRKTLEGLFKSVQGKREDPVEAIAELNRRFSRIPVALDTVLNVTENPWLDAPKGTFAGLLHEISNSLKLNNAELAGATLDKLELRIVEATSHELSEFYFLKGRLLTLSGQGDQAVKFYELATQSSPDRSKYHVALLEARLNQNYRNADFLRAALSEVQDQRMADYLSIKTKLLALLGKHDEALAALDNVEKKLTTVLRPLIYYLQRDYEGCNRLCEEYLSRNDLSENQRLALHMFQGRALFRIGSIAANGEIESQGIPFSGLPQMNPRVIRKSWESCKRGWAIAHSLGYPTDAELLIECSCVLSTYLNEQEFFYTHLKYMAKIRPNNLSLQETLLDYAMEYDDFKTAQQQLGKLPLSAELVVRQIFIFYREGNKHLAINSAITHVDLLLSDNPLNLDGALLLAAVAAQDLVKTQELETLLNAIRKLPNHAAIMAAYEFMAGVNQSLLQKKALLEKLYRTYEEGETDKRVLTLLYHNLDSTTLESANKLAKIADEIAHRRPFDQDEILHLCQAKATLKDWHGILETVDATLDRFEGSSRLLAIKALALDNLGDTPTALKTLEAAVSLDNSDSYGYQTYAQLAVRCGLTEKARDLFESLFARSRDNREKTQILRNMFLLEMSINPESPKVHQLCERYGEINDSSNEDEEGFYLLACFAASMNSRIEITAEQKKTFNERLQAYVSRFPESQVIRSVKFDESKPPEELLRELEKVTGMTAEKREWYSRQEQNLRTGNLPVPFAVRPLLLINVHDVLDLWEMSKRVTKQDRQYHLTLSQETYVAKEPSRFLSKKVLIDEVSLFVLFDLGLLEHFLKMFPRVAIPRAVIGRFQNRALGVFVSPWYRTAKDIVSILARFVSKIEQPPGAHNALPDSDWRELDEYKEVLKDEQYVLYTDDVMARIYMAEDNAEQETITIVDILELLRSKNVIRREDIAHKYARLCRWNVIGVPVQYRDILLVLHEDFPAGLTIDQSIKKLEQSGDYRDFTDAIWNYDKPYPLLLKDIAAFVVVMLEGQHAVSVENNIISAIWCWWYSKAQFALNGEVSKLDYLARSCWAIAVQLSRKRTTVAKPQIAQRLWSIYKDVVQHIHGNDMNESIELMMYQRLVHFIVSLAKERSPDEVYGFLASALEPGTTESEGFSQSYATALIQQHVKKQKSSLRQ